MDYSTSFESSRNQNIDIDTVLSARLEEFKQKLPERFSKSIYAMKAVHDNVPDEWKERLLQARNKGNGQRVILIPYNVESFHWTGILLKFNTDKNIELAQFMDPVEYSKFYPEKLQNQFAEIYPDVSLRWSFVEKHRDPRQSANLTIEYLLKATEELQLTNEQDTGMSHSHERTFDHHSASSSLIEEDRSFSTSTMSQSHMAKHRLLKQISNSEFEPSEIQDAPKVSLKASQTHQSSPQYHKQDRNSNNREEREFSREPRTLINSTNETRSFESHSSSSQNSDEIDRSVTKESLRNMYNDFHSMPPCSERSIINLLYLLSFKSMGRMTESDDSMVIPSQIDTEIAQQLKYLKERLKIEELQSIGIQNLVETCSINVKDENWQAALTIIRKLFKQLSPLNMQELFRLIEKVDDAAHLIKDKNIILFLGETGSGKSTTIHFLAGSQMQPVIVNGLNHITPINIRNPDLKKVTTSPFARSETRYITTVTVNFKHVGGFTDGDIILCDTPGFEDTNGPEVDIANGIGVVRAVKGCKSVKPVVLISYKSIGDRCRGVKELAHVVVGLIPGIKDNIRAFSYIFTKFPDSEKQTIHALLRDINDELNEEEKSNASFMSFLKDMLQKTRKSVRVLDPIKDRAGEILDELAESAAISYPDEVFQFFITEKSKTTVQEQVRKHQLSIMSATKRSEYLFVQYKLAQLKRLNNLLEQDYIEQIYDECIRYISKHLSEEYQNGISILNRCLINQTILSIDDIEQYRTYINHAKLADELRNDYLGKEVVHSSAFILYLDQQVDIILKSLQEKDINDLSAKTSLDKIKVLAMCFSDINNKYKDACQTFSDKYELVVKSYKNSVLEKNFTNIANDLTKLYDACSVLENHLNSESMKTKYRELKKYFLQVLKDSVSKLNYILSQEKYGNETIESIKECVRMFETASNTFTLQSHISKEDINQIYEDFLLKIMNHYEQIDEKIITELKGECSFRELEQLFAEITLIRTISIIESKTNRTYYSTLEQICGCIRELRREIEDILNGFYRNEKNNYNSLMRCLSSLKHAKWIEKYRLEVYADVINNTKEQILKHIKELEKNVMQTDLDLDNYDKIERIDNIVLEINDMKAVEEIVPNIGPHIEKINSRYKSEIDNVFTIINDTFDLEKWKTQKDSILDFSIAEKGFHYLNVCKRIHISFRNDSTLVINKLKGFIREFSNIVQNEMKQCFTAIKECKNENRQEIFDKSLKLLSRLEEVSEIKDKYSQVFSCFQNQKIIEEWERGLEGYLTDLSSEMTCLNAGENTEAVNNKLLIAKALSKLDRFLKGKKFNDIYSTYQHLFLNTTSDRGRQVIEDINNFKYEHVGNDMITLQTANEVGQHLFVQAKRVLNISIYNLMEETKTQAIMLGNTIEVQAIKLIVENLRRMQNAKKFISQYLDKPDEIDICIEEVKKLIEGRIKLFLVSVNALIKINNFYEADEKINSITLISNLLGTFRTQYIFEQLEELNKNQDEVVSNVVIKKYTEMDMSEYTLNPPRDIFDKLGRVSNINPRYDQALEAIRRDILTKFRKELDEAKKQQPPNPDNIHIRKFESGVRYLPKDMQESLEVDLKHCKDEIKKNIENNDRDLKDACDSKDLKRIKAVIQGYQQSEGMQYYANEGRKYVLKQTQDIIMKINENFKEYKIREALDNIETLYAYKVELENVVNIDQSCLEVRSKVTDIFQDVYHSCMKYFFNDKGHSLVDEMTGVIERNVSCLMEFMKFRDRFKNQSILQHMFPEDFNERLVLFCETIINFFNNCQQKYEKAKKESDFTSLKDVLDIMNKWNSTLTKIKNYDDMLYSNETLVTTIITCVRILIPYSTMLESISKIIKEIKNTLIQSKLINEDRNEIGKHRDERYKKFNEQFLILKKAKIFNSFHLNIDLNDIEKECLLSFEKKITDIISYVESILNRFSIDNHLTRNDYIEFNICYLNLISFRQEMTSIECGVKEKLVRIDKIIFDKINTWVHSAELDSTVQNVTTMLINMKRISMDMPSFKTKINERIDELLNYYKNITNDNMAFTKLGTLLNQDKTGIGQSIISEHKSFQGYSLSLFNEKTRRHDITYVLNNLEGDSIDRKLLEKRYDEFNKFYKELVQQNLKPNMKLDKLIENIKLIAGNIKQESDNIDWDAGIRKKVPELAAYIFALWTLKNAEHYFEAEGSDNRDNYLLQPHAAQVIAIFRMLGIGDKNEELKNNLVQIGTGEGKSITLGSMACILALLGFDVRCACYSQYLSQRDYQAFVPLFDSLGLLNYIHYGTFNRLCEDIINDNGDIRQVVEQIISKDSNTGMKNNQNIKCAKILLIDEVDVFFSRDFYGNVYTPTATLRDPIITSLVHLIWKERKSRLNLNRLKTTNEYNECCKKYPNWKLLFEEAMKDMLFDVNNFESHGYIVNQDKIGYVEQDNIVYNIAYGYKTLFAYFYEHERGQISKKSLDENIYVRIKCGSFSYAEIPLEFQYIMGVTGTLKTLSDPERKVIQSVYKITKNTYMPSVFGINNLKFTIKDDIMIDNESDYFNVIKREIEDRLVGKSSGKRAVLVFFESNRKLKEFYDSTALSSLKESTVYLTEEASLEEKEILIKRATVSGQITLFTKTFGRGTDFICHDQIVATNGGTHVIQTFLSEEISEEVQIKGRTARQGDHGSYSMVLLDRDLEKFHIEKVDIEDVKKGKGILTRISDALRITKNYDTIYDLLNERRIDLFKTQYDMNTKYVEHAREKHKIAKKFLSNLISGKIDSVKTFLIEENKGVEGSYTSRTVCLMDATGSMYYLLHKCKNTVDIMFERASAILKEQNIKSDSFQLQFVVYRNYNSKEDKILQSSPWETKPDNLRAFMNTIEVEGGWNNEAIEIGLWHANQENERENITQVILIGDAPPNTKDEVKEKRNGFKETYWKGTKFSKPTYYQDELDKLKAHSIPVHAFFVEQRAETVFKQIAQQTGGRGEMLDINSSSGSQMLTDLVTEEILRNVGGTTKGNALVEAYRNRYQKGYT
ncbi:unnamed protein product [Rotaria sp. Silwood1]|nr:unnamed protein product [Rotaria sp. Silwood1]